MALALTGCAHGVGVQLGTGFTTAEEALVWEAVDEWPADAYPDVMIHIERTGEIVHHGVERSGIENDATIRLCPLESEVMRFDASYFRRTVVHELGHTMGLHHMNNRPSIMNEYIDYATDRPQEFDILIAESNARNGIR